MNTRGLCDLGAGIAVTTSHIPIWSRIASEGYLEARLLPRCCAPEPVEDDPSSALTEG